MLDSAMMQSMSIDTHQTNAITVDVEDYFQVSAFESIVDRSNWSDFEFRVEANTDRILEIFGETGVTGTFFCLGWVAEKFPSLLQRIAEQGHEIASHGYSHVQVTNQSREDFRQDIRKTKALLEDISAQKVVGYRAASFSITPENPWAHDELAAAGHRYSSSTYPIRHDRYGAAGQPRFPHQRGESGLIELPVTPVKIGDSRFPCAGGGYFRLLPYWYTRWGIRRINRKDGHPVIFYLHPWEIDPDQPRFSGADRLSRFRHYVNLSGVQRKLRQLLGDFRWSTVADVYREHIGS